MIQIFNLQEHIVKTNSIMKSLLFSIILILNWFQLIRIQIQNIPAQGSNQPRPNIQVTGNVLIVIILSTISALLTALLIGAILCMIRPCCQSTLSQSNYQVDSNISNGQTLLQKLQPPYYNVNTYGPFDAAYESNWNQSLV